MRWSKALIPTLKETPTDAVAPSHQLLLRAGMIRQLGSGAYTYLPLGFRVLRKVIQIVREEMDAAGALELVMPALQPIELWKETGRYETFGDLLMQLKISNDQHLALGPTHEEVVTDLARGLISSYKQLPITLYQIQTKFRDEPRPRFGVLRTREFIMKDAYSFDADIDQLNRSYDAMYEAYCRTFDRCGIPYVIVEAESGPIGGDSSHEFMIPAKIGEDVILRCERCGYAANVERAQVGTVEFAAVTGLTSLISSLPPMEKVETPNRKTIEQVAKFLKVRSREVVKTLIYLADDQPVAVLIRGDHEANESKIRRAFDAKTLVPADPETVVKATGAPVGFVGPIGLQIPCKADTSVASMMTMVVGGNEVDTHYRHVVPGRDFNITDVQDLRNAVNGDPCPKSGDHMIETRGIEVGHVFKLGTKYSSSMGANFTDDKGALHPIIMGCYGIGVNRIVAGAVEASNDQDGIIWPLAIAPFDVEIVPLQVRIPEVLDFSLKLHSQLKGAGLEVLTDDRDQQIGPKLKDADLIGIPLRVVVGDKSLKAGHVEVKWRHEPKEAVRQIPVDQAAEEILKLVDAARKAQGARCAQKREKRLNIKSDCAC